MAGSSYPFDDGPGATITEDQWSYLMRDAVGTGVHEANTAPGPEGQELKVFSLAEPGLIYVRPGRASSSGFHYQQGAIETIAVAANASATQDRIDLMVLRLDLTTNTIALETKLGTPSDTPVAPSLAATEMSLASFRVRKSSNTVLANEVTDLRSFIGRRMTVTNLGNTGREGDIQYVPFFESWQGVVPGGFSKDFAFAEDLTDHAAASDPHPNYARDSDFTGSTVSITAASLITLNLNYGRSINLPGGFKLIHLNLYGTFNGATDQGGYTLGQIDSSAYWPSFSHFYSANQWKFQNSTDDIPLIVRVDPTGQIVADNDTFLMGASRFAISAFYFKGTGV